MWEALSNALTNIYSRFKLSPSEKDLLRRYTLTFLFTWRTGAAESACDVTNIAQGPDGFYFGQGGSAKIGTRTKFLKNVKVCGHVSTSYVKNTRATGEVSLLRTLRISISNWLILVRTVFKVKENTFQIWRGSNELTFHYKLPSYGFSRKGIWTCCVKKLSRVNIVFLPSYVNAAQNPFAALLARIIKFLTELNRAHQSVRFQSNAYDFSKPIMKPGS